MRKGCRIGIIDTGQIIFDTLMWYFGLVNVLRWPHGAKKNMSNLLHKVETMLESSLEDYVMSRSERREFKDLLRESRGDSKQQAMVRQLAFKMAQAKAEESPLVMEWLENVIKILFAKESEVDSRAYFSPGEECLNQIRAFISGATESLDICIFTLTDNRIVERIQQAQGRGVKIRLLADNDKSKDLGADVLRLQREGIPTVLDVTDAHMHHKFAIADGKRLLGGSYNWTRAAASENNENIFVTNDGRLVRQFQQEFERLWDTLLPLQ